MKNLILHTYLITLCQLKVSSEELPRVNLFWTSNFESHIDCMKFCQKLGSRSPPVITSHQWKAFEDTIKPSVFQDNQTLIYLSATEGNDINGLKNFDHWPKSTVAKTGVLRDYYTGQELENYVRLWIQRTALGKHCVSLSKGNPPHWNATSCQGMQGNAWCPCQEAPLHYAAIPT